MARIAGFPGTPRGLAPHGSRGAALVSGAALAASLLATAGHAVITVTNTNDAGAGSLRDAIQQANAQPGPDTIQLSAAGTIFLQSPLPSLADSVTLEGLGPTQSVVDAQGVGRIAVVGSFNAGDTFRIQGFTFTGGFEDGDGGALYLSTGNELELVDCVFATNQATGNGGALRSNGSLAVRDTWFDDNQAGNIGGAIYAFDGDLSLHGSVFSNNRNPNRGGALLSDVPTTITDTRFSGNQSIEGGAVYFSESELTLQRSRLDDNQADRGGGLYARCFSAGPCAMVRIEDTTFSNNRALSPTVGPGGGLYALELDLDVSSSTFSGNQAAGDGGGLHLAGASRARLVNLTVASNTAADGGGIASTSSLIVQEIANNVVSDNGPNDCDRSLGVAGAHNLSSDQSCGFVGSGDRQGVDPRLAPLADGGGPAPDHELMPGSPAIDAGDDATCTPLDQRGNGRQRVCDLGAVEFLAEPGCGALALWGLSAAWLVTPRRSQRGTRARTG